MDETTEKKETPPPAAEPALEPQASLETEAGREPEPAAEPEERPASEQAQLIDAGVENLRSRLSQGIIDLQDLARELDARDQKLLLDQALRMVNSPYLFVVVGEVKSGKSSFINALLGREICEVAPSPCTDEIQEITYGAKSATEVLGPKWKRIRQPIPLLKWIAMVDTPGTNSVIKDHEIITRKYVPHSDLVIFVFPAKNPYTASAWELLEFVSEEWRRKVIFVLQQADLEPNLAVQIEGVRQQAIRHGVDSPKVFATSALQEEQGEKPKSGFEALREFIRSKVTAGQHFAEKLASEMSALHRVLDSLGGMLSEAKQKLDDGKALRERVRQRLGSGQQRARKEVDQVIGRLLDSYDALTGDFREHFREGVKLSKIIRRLFGGGPSTRQWMDETRRNFEAKLNKKVDAVSAEESRRFIDSIQGLMAELLHETNQSATPAETAAAFSKIQIERDEILASIRRELAALTNDLTPLVGELTSSARWLSPILAIGGLLAIAGTGFALWAQEMRWDIAGWSVAGFGVLLMLFMLFKRSAILSRFNRGLKEGRKQFERELRDNLNASLRGIFDSLDAKFNRYDEMLAAQEEGLLPKLEKLESTQGRLAELESELALLSQPSKGGYA